MEHLFVTTHLANTRSSNNKISLNFEPITVLKKIFKSQRSLLLIPSRRWWSLTIKISQNSPWKEVEWLSDARKGKRVAEFSAPMFGRAGVLHNVSRIKIKINRKLAHLTSLQTSWFPGMSSIWLLLFLVCTAAITSESVNYDACPELWRKSFLVTDNQCPRFVYVQTGIEHGLGDQLERLFLAMSIIHGRWSQTRSIKNSTIKLQKFIQSQHYLQVILRWILP